MIGTAKKMNRELIAVITGMEEPLGFAVGNALEVKEALDTLKGHGPEDLTNLCLELGSYMLKLAGHKLSHEEGINLLRSLIENGQAYEKFKELCISQGGDIEVINNVDLLPKSAFSYEYKSKVAGYISHLSAMDIGLASVRLGAGRETKESPIDHSAGIVLTKKVGALVNIGDTLAVLHANDAAFFSPAEQYLDLAYTFSETKPTKEPLIFKTIQ